MYTNDIIIRKKKLSHIMTDTPLICRFDIYETYFSQSSLTRLNPVRVFQSDSQVN